MKKEMSAATYTLFYLILATALAGVIWAYFLPVELSILARGQVSFLGEPRALSATHNGIVEKVLVKTASEVSNDQEILSYRSRDAVFDDVKGGGTKLQSLQNTADGVLMWQRELMRGDMVREGERLAVVYPAAPIGLEIHLLDRDLGRVQQGMTVRIALDAYPHQNYGVIYGEVQDFSLQMGPEPGREMELVVLVSIEKISREAIRLRPGLVANVEIITGKTTLLKKVLF